MPDKVYVRIDPAYKKWRFDFRSYVIGVFVCAILSPICDHYFMPVINKLFN